MHVTNTRKLARPPWGTSLLNKLYLLSPRTWLGALRTMANYSMPPNCLDLDAFVQGWLGILLPMVVLWCVTAIHNNYLATSPSIMGGGINLQPTRMMLCSLMSPWTWGCVQKLTPELRMIGSFSHKWTVYRNDPLDEAIWTLHDRMQRGRAYRTRRYDVYLPEKPDNAKQLLMFLPGAMVPHTAYSQVAAEMSDSGIVVVVLSMEPCRMAAPLLGADLRDMKRILRRVNNTLPVPVKHWSLGGHSMGAYAVMRLAPQLKPPDLVLWAFGTFKDLRTNLSSETFRVLIIQGSCDNMVQFTPQSEKDFRMDLPPQTIYKVIKGGNHCGFASYPAKEVYDGVAEIPRRRQHQLACKETVNFLLQDS